MTLIAGSVFYDADCAICANGARRFEPTLRRRHFQLEPLQTPDACARLGLRESERLTEMRLRLADGTVHGGAAAVVELARRIWWAWPLWALSRLPGAMPALRSVYGWIARHRTCGGGSCAVSSRVGGGRAFALAPLATLPTAALFLRSRMSAWMFMWAMAAALYISCKWLTYRDARERGVAVASYARLFEYLFAWPGMDAAAFLGGDRVERKPGVSEWSIAAIKTALGASLVWSASRLMLPGYPLLAGWTAMTGVAFVLHFGTFHLLSAFWRSRGIRATPVMRNPLRSTSLADFWGRRWNTAYHELVARFTFQPLRSRVGTSAASLLVFLISGAVHELVISLPARGGYGLPTAYFVVQGLGLAGERSLAGRRLGLGRGWRGRVFTLAIAAGPAYLLFHPAFVHRVILPMLSAIAAR